VKLTAKSLTTVLSLSLLLFVVPLPAAHAAIGPTCYVDVNAAGLNNGNSWVNAYTSLQMALNDVNCTDIRVAEGVYKPGAAETDTFSISAGEEVYGGYAGADAVFAPRDPLLYGTI